MKWQLVVVVAMLVIVAAAAGLYWRRKILARDGIFSGREAKAPVSISVPLPEPVQPIELHMGTSQDKPLVTVSPLSERELPSSARVVSPNNTAINRLSPLLQAVPSVLTASEFGQGHYMKVVVNGPLSAAADGQSLMPFVRGTDGKISSLAKLMDPENLSTLVNAAMLFQVASVLVAQKHLADINKKLDEIMRGVEEIKSFQQNERKAVIIGALKYLEQHIPSILKGEFSDAVRHQLEAIERALLGVQDHLAVDLRAKVDRIASITGERFGGTKRLRDEIDKHQTELHEEQQQWLLCLRARIANWQVLSTFPGDHQLKITRQRAIRESMREVIDSEGLFAVMDERFREKIESIDSIWNKQATLDMRKAFLHEMREIGQRNVMLADKTMSQDLDQSGARLLDYQKPVTLALRLEAGRVVEALEL